MAVNLHRLSRLFIFIVLFLHVGIGVRSPIHTCVLFFFFFFQAEDGIRDDLVTGVQTCALPIFFSSHLRCACFPSIPPAITKSSSSALTSATPRKWLLKRKPPRCRSSAVPKPPPAGISSPVRKNPSPLPRMREISISILTRRTISLRTRADCFC